MSADRLRPHLPILAFLVMAVIAVYGRTIGHDFLSNWDDTVYVTANSSIQGFSAANIRTVFSNYYAGNYAPVQMLSYMLDYTLWGLWPGGFLLTNIIFHTLNGLLFYLLLLRLHGERLLAAVGAAIFLLHPVQVESVAWISQRKNLLALFFMMLAWLAYIRYRDSAGGKNRRAYWSALVMFACALLSKSAAVFFPVVLLLHDGCFSAERRKVRLLDKVPFFVLAGAVSFMAILSQSPEVTGWSGMDFGGRRAWHGGSPWTTLLTMLPVFCRYLRMIVWPSDLSALYAPPLHLTPDSTVLTAALILFAVVLLAWRLYLCDRCLGFWPIFSALAILPVSQIIPLVTLMNDRYLYFPMLGVAALGGAGAIVLRERTSLRVTMGGALALLLTLAAVSAQRVGVWKNSRTLWRDAVKKVPEKFDAWEGLGEAYHLSAPVSLPEADYAYSRAYRIYSSGPNNLYNLARVKIQLGDDLKGAMLLKRLLKINPEYVIGWAELGDIYLKQHLYRDAEHAYMIAEKMQPEALEINLRLFRLHTVSGDMAKAKFYAARIETLGGEVPGLSP